MENEFSPSLPVKTLRSVTEVDTRVVDEVVEEADSEMIEVEEEDTTDTLVDLNYNMSTP
jgi:hypothetical protein